MGVDGYVVQRRLDDAVGRQFQVMRQTDDLALYLQMNAQAATLLGLK